MTAEQQKTVKDAALRLKRDLKNFCGSVTFHLSPKFEDVKIKVEQSFTALYIEKRLEEEVVLRG